MLSNKGISHAIGWVLLVGLSVSLAIFIGIWLRTQSEKTITGVADSLEKDTKCDDTLLKVIPNCGNVVGMGIVIVSLNLTNKGLFTIYRLQCNLMSVDLVPGLFPDGRRRVSDGLGQPLNNCINTATVVIMPFVNLSNGELFGCASKRVRATC